MLQRVLKPVLQYSRIYDFGHESVVPSVKPAPPPPPPEPQPQTPPEPEPELPAAVRVPVAPLFTFHPVYMHPGEMLCRGPHGELVIIRPV